MFFILFLSQPTLSPCLLDILLASVTTRGALTDQVQSTAYNFMASLAPFVFPKNFAHVYCHNCWIWRPATTSFPCCWSCGQSTSAWLVVNAPKPKKPAPRPGPAMTTAFPTTFPGPAVQLTSGYGQQPIYQVVSPVSANWMFNGYNNAATHIASAVYPAYPSYNLPAVSNAVHPGPVTPHAVTQAHNHTVTQSQRANHTSSTASSRINTSTLPMTLGTALHIHPQSSGKRLSNTPGLLSTYRSTSCPPVVSGSTTTISPYFTASSTSSASNNHNNNNSSSNNNNGNTRQSSSSGSQRYQILFIDWPTYVQREGQAEAVQLLVRILARGADYSLAVQNKASGEWRVVFD